MDLIRLQDTIEKASRKLLNEWRACGKDDAMVLRDKLIECGWKFRRTGGGEWYHPSLPDYPAPESLRELARTIATQVVKEALHGKGEE